MHMNLKKPKMRQRQEVINRGGKYPLLLILVMLVLIAIPTGIVVNLLYQGYIRTGTPILGDRFTNDLNPSITKQQIERIDSTLTPINGVKNVEVELQTGTVKIYVTVDADIAAEAYEPLANQLLSSVYTILPVETYFTSTNTRRQYDLEVNLYNVVSATEEKPLVYLIAYKNAMMETSNTQMVSNAINPELAEKLRADELARKLAKDNPQGQEGGISDETVETDSEAPGEVESAPVETSETP